MPDEIKTPDKGYTPPKSNTPKLQTIEMPSAPPEHILKQEFKLDEKLLSGNDEGRVIVQDASGSEKPATIIPKIEDKVPETKKEESKTVVKEEESKKEESKKEEEKPRDELGRFLKPPTGEKKEQIEVKTEEIKQITPVREKIARDYSGYSDEEISHFKQMSDSSYKYVTDLIKEKKEFIKSKDTTFLQHPDAYTLSPQYKEMQNKSMFAKKEGDYWAACLEQLEAGKPIKDLVGWDENGNPRFGDEFQPTKRVEELARMAMNNCYTAARQSQTELQQYPNQFKNRVQEDLRAINSERARRFAWVSDPKLMDYTLNMGDAGEVPIKTIRQQIISLFPPYLQSNPATEVAADLFVAIRIQDAELREERNGKHVAEIKQDEAKRGEPTSEVKPGKQPDAIGGVREFSLSDLPK